MLVGRYYSNISLKGRVSLPSKFRKETGNNLIVARWYDQCLIVVGESGWNLLLERFSRRDEVVTKPIRGVERFILSTAFEAQTDDQGRFVIPPTLRETAGLKDEIVFMGLGDRIELWDKKAWELEEIKIKNEADSLLEEISRKRKS